MCKSEFTARQPSAGFLAAATATRTTANNAGRQPAKRERKKERDGEREGRLTSRKRMLMKKGRKRETDSAEEK